MLHIRRATSPRVLPGLLDRRHAGGHYLPHGVREDPAAIAVEPRQSGGSTCHNDIPFVLALSR